MIDEKKVIFIIPAYNEELNIARVINEIKNEFKSSKILVINDCSKDKTKDTIKKAFKQ